MAINKIVFGNQTLIDLTADTIEPQFLKSGITAHDKSGATISGTSTLDSDTSDADALASEILDKKTAYVGGTKVTGAMPNKGAVAGTISSKSEIYSVPMGYHDGSGTVQIDATEQAKIKGENIKAGVEILGVTGTYSGAGVKAQKKVAEAYTDKNHSILPDSGFDYLSEVEISKISYSLTPNAAGGDTATIGTVSPV